MPTAKHLTFVGSDGKGWFEVVRLGAPRSALADGSQFPGEVEVKWRRMTPAAKPDPTDIDAVIAGLNPQRSEIEDRLVGPSVQLRIVVHQGRAEVDEMRVERSAGDPEINATTLREIPLSEVVNDVVRKVAGLIDAATQVAHLTSAPAEPDGYRAIADSMHTAGESAVSTRRRRTMTDELLQEVAAVYLADTTGAPTQAVANHFFTGHRNATRYVAKAKDKGFINKTEEQS